MGSLNLPIPADYQPLSLSDSVSKWAQIEDNKQRTDLARMQEERMGKQAEQESKIKELAFGSAQRAAHNDILKAYKTELYKKAEMTGVQPNSPQFQQLANDIYAKGGYDKLMQNTGAPAFQPGTNIDLAHVETVMTPDEEHARKLKETEAEWNARLPYQRELAKIEDAQHEAQAGMNYKNNVAIEGVKHGYNIDEAKIGHDYKIAELESKGNEPKPMSEYQQAKLQEDHDKIESEAASALDQIKSSRDNLTRLSALQDKVTTGKISGSPIIAGTRIIAGDQNLEELEKGYAKASLEAIGALKAGGTTLGALSEKEGDWVRRANMSIQNTGKVNKDLMDEGIKLLDNREKTIKGTLGMRRQSLNRVMTGGQYEPMAMPETRQSEQSQSPETVPQGTRKIIMPDGSTAYVRVK